MRAKNVEIYLQQSNCSCKYCIQICTASLKIFTVHLSNSAICCFTAVLRQSKVYLVSSDLIVSVHGLLKTIIKKTNKTPHKSATDVILFACRGGPAEGEHRGHCRWTGDGGRSRGGVRGREAEIKLLSASYSRPSAKSNMGRGHGDVRVLIMGRLHPAGQADLQAVRRTVHSHMVRHHVELPLLSSVLHRPSVQES